MGGRRTKVISGATEKKATPRKKARRPVKEGAVPKKPAAAGAPGARKAKSRTRREAKEKVRGKRYQETKKKVELGKLYPLTEAVKLVKETSIARFDSSVEAHINLGLDPGRSEHKIRTTVSLPHGTGKKVRVLVFAGGKAAPAASDAGADEIGDESTIEKIAATGKVGFDAIIATPDFMPKLAKIARILGPQGLMPSPRTGTISDEPAKVVAELKKGRVELRTEAQPIIHTVIGKVSFPDKSLIENLGAISEALNRVKPGGVREEYIKSVYLKATIGPSVRVDTVGIIPA